MDWEACKREGIAKQTKPDHNLAISLVDIAEAKERSARMLPGSEYYAIITLLYDSASLKLEAVSASRGLKIYNHDCITGFLEEIMANSKAAKSFDVVRKIRNSINYYGRKIEGREVTEIIRLLEDLISLADGLVRKELLR